jgi:hypothetical protein
MAQFWHPLLKEFFFLSSSSLKKQQHIFMFINKLFFGIRKWNYFKSDLAQKSKCVLKVLKYLVDKKMLLFLVCGIQFTHVQRY